MITLILNSCSDGIRLHETTIFALDTVITIKLSDDSESDACVNLINYYEQLLTTDPPLELINEAIEIADNTDGTFNPALKPITSLWKKEIVPDHIDLSDIDYNSPTAQFDLGGIGKGYICEKVTDYLIDQNVEYGVLSFGGNISVFGDCPDGRRWSVGIRDPYDLNAVTGYLMVDSGYISVSGDYQRYFEHDGKRYHHIIDPSTGYPSESGVNSVAVWCDDGVLADALSTALFVMGVDEGMRYHGSGVYEFEVMYITADGITMSEGFRQNFIENAT